MPRTALPPLVLRNGTRIENVLETTLEFVAKDSSYRNYDLAPVLHDDVLTEQDIRVANAIIARMPRRVIAAIHQRAPAINAALAHVPADATLAAPEEKVPWAPLEELLRAMDGIDEVKLPRATKVLHKKRPALIPVLDEIVQKYLRAVDPLPRSSDLAHDAIALIRSYKHEMDANLSTLRALREELRQHRIELTECRLLDIFVWAYSGTYAPLHLSAAAGPQVAADFAGAEVAQMSKPSPQGPAPVPATAVRVEVFRDDEDGYLAWIAAHPDGFVLNTARSPRRDYLILHRARCHTITRRSTRGGP